MNIEELVKKSQQGDKDCINKLFDLYTPLIKKNCYLFGSVDEDLKSELGLAFLKCIKYFKYYDEISSNKIS